MTLIEHFSVQQNILTSHKQYQPLKANFQPASAMPYMYYAEERCNLYFQAREEPEEPEALIPLSSSQKKLI